MGCDFSLVVKQSFRNKVNEIEKLKQKCSGSVIKIEKMITEVNEFQTEEIDIVGITGKMERSVARLEALVSDMKKLKMCQTNDSLKLQIPKDIKDCNNSSPRENKHKNSQKYRKSEKRKNPDLESPSKNQASPESILQDPEILALINKNRCRLMKKLTR